MFREEEVRRGITLFDQELNGWRSRFNPGTLDITKASSCVFGQIFYDDQDAVASFYHGVDWLRKTVGEDVLMADYGVFRRGREPILSQAFYEEYRQLGETWKTLVPQTVDSRELVLV